MPETIKTAWENRFCHHTRCRADLSLLHLCGTCGDYSVDSKDINLEILHFKQFYKHFVFEKDEEGYVKKTQKNYMDVRVVLQLV